MILMTGIGATCIFIVIFAMLGLRINADMTCGRDTQGAHSQAVYDNRSDLDNDGDYVLQEFELNSSFNYIKHEFCFTVFCVNPDGCQIDVINQDEAVLMTEFENEGQHVHCSAINNITDHQYLGLSCPTCTNATTELKVQEVVAGDLVNVLDNNLNSFTIVKDQELTLTLISYKSCHGLLKWFTWWYIVLLLLLFLLLLIIVGFRRFEHWLFEEMPKFEGN